ncbi:hypothetical protein PLUTE_a5001 [Pseudoalteromonas luteoviolacea DSM 6061]|nr:hypothetical protein [Pseudoalteromonas luteoviolacea DSM 6061]
MFKFSPNPALRGALAQEQQLRLHSKVRLPIYLFNSCKDVRIHPKT